MFTDMVGYTALGQRNESLSLALVEEQRRLIRPILSRHNGREVKTIGDAFLVEFPNALDAVRCAYDIQRAVREFNITLSEERRVHLRVGVHLGDVTESDGDISGDAVNIASRIEPLAEDGGVCITRQVYDHVHSKVDLRFSSMGLKSLKNVTEPMEVYLMVMPWERDVVGTSSELDRNRVAVLPLKNISPDPNDEYFADGLTEELISTMSKISRLTVISRTSVTQYKDKPKPMDQVGRELKAGTILEGSVRKAGNRIRITIQMIDAIKDAHLWAESYDRELEDIFAVQSDIARRVAASLSVQLLSNEREDIEKRPTESTEAYQLYLKGRYHVNRRWAENRKDNEKALRYFEEALRLDARCALAHAGISDCYHAAVHANWFTPEVAYAKMREHAKKAIELDSRLAEGHAALGAEYMHYEWMWREAEEELKMAIALKPSYDLVYGVYSYLVAVMGRFDEEYDLVNRAQVLDPISGSYVSLLGPALWRVGRREEAIGHMQKAVDENPESPFAHDALGFAYYRASRIDEAISELRKAVALANENPALQADLAFLLALVGHGQEAKSILDQLKELSKKTYVSGVQTACILYVLGKQDEAFEYLEQACERRAIDLPDIRLLPEMRQLCEDRRWISIENRMGLPHLNMGT
jgi:adenylate cyclase